MLISEKLLVLLYEIHQLEVCSWVTRIRHKKQPFYINAIGSCQILLCLSHVDFGPSLININRSRKKSSSYNWRIVKGELRKKKLESRILFVIFGGYILSLQYWVANTFLVFSLFTNKDVGSLDLTCLVVLCSHTFFYVWYFLMYGWLLKRLRKKQFWSNYSLFRVESY